MPVIDTIDAVVWHHDSPTVLRGRYPQWQVLRAASAEVTVVINGQGSDELLGGYSRFLLPYMLDVGLITRETAARHAKNPRRFAGDG